VITLGANGCLLATADGMQHVPPFPVTPIDTTGAGDAFTGSLACFLAEGCPEPESLSRANLYAALSTLGPGTQKSFVMRERFEAEWSRR
jgi:ribokinase